MFRSVRLSGREVGSAKVIDVGFDIMTYRGSEDKAALSGLVLDRIKGSIIRWGGKEIRESWCESARKWVHTLFGE